MITWALLVAIHGAGVALAAQAPEARFADPGDPKLKRVWKGERGKQGWARKTRKPAATPKKQEVVPENPNVPGLGGYMVPQEVPGSNGIWYGGSAGRGKMIEDLKPEHPEKTPPEGSAGFGAGGGR